MAVFESCMHLFQNFNFSDIFFVFLRVHLIRACIRFAQHMLAEMSEFCARGAPKFRKFCNSFVKFLRRFRVISTPDAHFFGSEQPSDFTESCSDVTTFAQRTLAECIHYFSASGMPKFRKFCNSFAKLLRKFCVISTVSAPGAHFFGSEQSSNFTKSCSDVTIFFAANAGRIHAIIFAQGAPKFRKSCNSFARFSHKICVISTPRGARLLF